MHFMHEGIFPDTVQNSLSACVVFFHYEIFVFQFFVNFLNIFFIFYK